MTNFCASPCNDWEGEVGRSTCLPLQGDWHWGRKPFKPKHTHKHALLISRISLRFKNLIFIHADILQLLLAHTPKAPGHHFRLFLLLRALLGCTCTANYVYFEIFMYSFGTSVSKSHVNGALFITGISSTDLTEFTKRRNKKKNVCNGELDCWFIQTESVTNLVPLKQWHNLVKKDLYPILFHCNHTQTPAGTHALLPCCRDLFK